MCAYNCLDEEDDRKITITNKDFYNCNLGQDELHKLGLPYICTGCSPNFLDIIRKGKNDSAKNENDDKENKSSNIADPTEAASSFVVENEICFPFSSTFSSSHYASNVKQGTLTEYETIQNMFICISRRDVSPWTVFLQNGKTGIMLHFHLQHSSEHLPKKKVQTILSIFVWPSLQCFIFGPRPREGD